MPALSLLGGSFRCLTLESEFGSTMRTMGLDGAGLSCHSTSKGKIQAALRVISPLSSPPPDGHLLASSIL